MPVPLGAPGGRLGARRHLTGVVGHYDDAGSHDLTGLDRHHITITGHRLEEVKG